MKVSELCAKTLPGQQAFIFDDSHLRYQGLTSDLPKHVAELDVITHGTVGTRYTIYAKGDKPKCQQN